MANKYLALQGKKFDKSKVTVVGSPTITSDGVVTATSGYGTNCPWIYNIPALGKNWEIIMPYYSNATDWHSVDTILREMKTSYSEFSIGSYGSMFYIWLKDINGTNLNTTFGSYKQFPMPFGKMLIKLKCNYIDGKYVLNIYLSQNDGMWILDKTITSDVAFFPCENTMNFCFMVHAIDEGFINLPEFKIYSNNQLVYSPTKPTYLLERRKPTVWNKGQFEIVGNPSISDDGVASGFKASNYIKTPLLDFSKPFEILSQFTLNTGATTTSFDNYIFSTASNRYFSVAVMPNLKIRARLGNGTAWTEYATNYTCNIGTKYYIKLKYDGTTFNLYISTNGKDYSLILTKELNVTYPTSEALGLGILPVVNGGEMYGLIPLKDFKVYSQDNLVFDGGADTYVYDPSKFTIVGSPTITEYGVASGFSSGNYIKANISSLDLTDNFELSFQITTSSDVSTEQSVWGTTCNNQAFVYQIFNGFFRLYYPTGTGERGSIDFGEVEANKTYNITLSCKNGTLTIQDYNKSFSFLGSTITFLYMGSGRVENSIMFKGSIDLPQFSITADGKEVFTGTKEQFYMLSV